MFHILMKENKERKKKKQLQQLFAHISITKYGF